METVIHRMHEAWGVLGVALVLSGCAGGGAATGGTSQAAGRAIAGAGTLPAAVVERRVAEIEALERRRFAAMVAVDTAVLGELLGERLRYCHSNGSCESKSQFLEALASGQTRYRAIEVLELEPRVVGTAVVAHGRAAITGESRGQALQFQIMFTDVYESSPTGWQLVAWQSTRLP